MVINDCLSTTENTFDNDSMLKSMNLNFADTTIPMNHLIMIFNLCDDIAKKITEQVLDTIEHLIDSTP
ncbi:unnamed protein product [Rotaria sp. Silwood1]|nr:unnamed protein product [Rotaria sp. Silwood1]